MQHRIRAAVLIVSDGKLLLVKNQHPQTGGIFWTPPGGGLENEETLLECAQREAFEECGLHVEVGRLLYLREFVDLEFQRHHLEVFFLAHSYSGAPTIANVRPQDIDVHYIKEAGFLSRAEMDGLTVFPEVLKDGFWEDMASGFTGVRYLGQQRGDTRDI